MRRKIISSGKSSVYVDVDGSASKIMYGPMYFGINRRVLLGGRARFSVVMVQATSFDHVTINNQTNDVRLRQDVCLAVVSASKRCLS